MKDQLDQKQQDNQFFFTSRVANLITKSTCFEIGHVKNLNQSETVIIGFGGNPDRGKCAGFELRPRISKCHKENVSYFSKDLEGFQIRNGPGGTACQNRQM